MAEFTPTPEREVDDSPLSASDHVMETTEANDELANGDASSSGKGSRKHASPSGEEDDPMKQDDAGGLFGSGSEDEDGKYVMNVHSCTTRQ